MKVAVLACGPSLPTLWKPHNAADYGLVIGVNTAGWLYTVDWLAFTDTHIITPIRAGEYPQPRIGYITNTGQVVPPDRKRILLPLYHRGLGNLTAPLRELAASQGMTECGYTFPNALHQAQLWAEGGRIDVFGFDCAMQRHDAAGQEGYHTRKRWLTELPWIKSQWGPNVLAVSMVNPTIIKWFEGRAQWGDVQALFPKPLVPEPPIEGVGVPICKNDD